MSLPLLPDDPLLPRFRAVLDRNFPSLSTVEDLDRAIPRPIGFYDRHLSSHLILKRVRIIPSLHESLANSIIDPLKVFSDKGHTLKYEEYDFISRTLPREPVGQATSVALAYDDIFASEMVHIATKMLFTPETPEWIPVMNFIPGDYEALPGVLFFTEARHVVNSDGKTVRIQPSYLAPKLPLAARDLANDLGRVFEWISHWSFFSHTKWGRSVVSLMPSMTNFNWECAHTTGVPVAKPLVPNRPPDAHQGFAKKEIEQYLEGRRKIVENSDPPVAWSKKHDVKIPRRKVKRPYTPIPKDYIQKAWSSAVREDVTYMVFNSGSHERVGIRHRESQTLYLSGLIGTGHTNPSYGKIHLGLALCIIQDAIDRRELREEYDTKFNASLKRHVTMELDVDEDTPPLKRRKTADGGAKLSLVNSLQTYHVSVAETEISTRSALLISLHFDNFNSPSPSCFTRIGSSCVRGLFNEHFTAPPRRTLYSTSQYMTARLRPPIGRGAIGIAHRATLAVTSTLSKSLEHDCLVKLAFTEEGRAALKKEFDIYQHLSKKDVVSGILRVHGLFEDTETDTLALIMDYGGYSLRRRELEEDMDFSRDYVSITEEEWTIYLEAFRQIHASGICHNDVRIDNIVINHANEVAIIDFDRATFTNESFDHDEEISHLKDILEYSEYDSVDGEGVE
ncbi:hypothetical protein D9619_012713 [Psilocybe cf. subviscida]|uniref:Protein kinase domain-containing protein n=1 Tax=Psilocybe cf. subviscida TaxID=2480587 RepID=A0A8H5ERA7_9AGAR|nr:hypothetical protein D9619_012713 [Psilocybe cf. subviscida]